VLILEVDLNNLAESRCEIWFKKRRE